MTTESGREAADYVCGARDIAAWCDARDAAEAWVRALTASGIETEGLRVRPCTGAGGAGEVQVWATPELMRWAAEMVARSAGAAWGQEAC
jgi:hypothetical protein